MNTANLHHNNPVTLLIVVQQHVQKICKVCQLSSQPQVIRDLNPDFLIWVSVGSLPKCSGFILLSASVILPFFLKIGRWMYEKNKSSKYALFRSGWASGKVIQNPYPKPDHCHQFFPLVLNRQPYEGRLPLTSWWRKSSNMTVGQCSLIYLAHHCYDWHPRSRCG